MAKLIDVFNSEMGRLLNIEVDKKKEQIINYLENNKEQVILDYKSYGIDDVTSFKENPEEFLKQEQINVADDKIELRNYNKKLMDLVSKYMSKDIKSLTIPGAYFFKNSEFKYPNLQSISLIGGVNVNYDAVKVLLNQTKIRKIKCGYIQDDKIKENSYGLTSYQGNIYCINDMTIEDGNYKTKDNEFTCFSKNFANDIDKILGLVDNYKNKNEEINHIIISESPDWHFDDEKIEYEKYKKGSTIYEYNFAVAEKDTTLLKIKDISSIVDVVNIVNSFEKRGLKFDDLNVILDNKTYEDIELLRILDKKYNLKIKYKNSNEFITTDEFISMREAIDYYKTIVDDPNLSNLEKITVAYDIIKSFEYREVEDFKDRQNSRNISSIVRDGNIVCVGYSAFLSELLKEVGIDSWTISTSVPTDGGRYIGHQRNVIVVDDDKYNIHGNYAFDATWDSAKGITRYVDDKGNETLKTRKNPPEENERIVRKYDDLCLYRSFLISDENYNKRFAGEKYPDFENAVAYSNNDNLAKDNVFLGNDSLTVEKFIELLYNVRLKEGYSDENVKENLEGVLDLSLTEKKKESINISEKIDEVIEHAKSFS